MQTNKEPIDSFKGVADLHRNIVNGEDLFFNKYGENIYNK